MASVRRPCEKLCASAFHLSKVRKRAPKVGGFAAHFACGFFEFGRGGTRWRIIFLEALQSAKLTLSNDNKKHDCKKENEQQKGKGKEYVQKEPLPS